MLRLLKQEKEPAQTDLGWLKNLVLPEHALNFFSIIRLSKS